MLASALRAAGRDGDAGHEIKRALVVASSLEIEPQALVLLATACVKAGRTEDARAVLATLRKRSRLGNPVDASAEAYTLGLIALTTNHPDSALRATSKADLVPNRAQLLLVRAEALRSLGRFESARVAIDSLRTQHSFGTESEEDWLHAPLVMGDILLAQGDTVQAIRQYQSIVDQWRVAPPTTPDVVAARTRIASLRGTLDRGQTRQAGIQRPRP